MNVLTANEKLEELINSCDEISAEISDGVKNNREDLVIRLKESILADPHLLVH